MQNRIVEIASDSVHLSVSRGFLKLSRSGEELGRVGLPEIGGLVVRGYGASISLNLVGRLSELNIPVVLCGQDQSPSSIVWPVRGHHAQGYIVEAQGRMSLPRRKRLWQTLVKAKISAQAEVLSLIEEPADDLVSMAGRVRSGDPDNIEAQAARRYWPRMIGTREPGFVRRGSGAGANGWLNYGYTVLRASAARSLLAAGLHPGLPIHHQSRGEALRLASDVMEPFRPYIDLAVRQQAAPGGVPFPDLIPETKAALVRTLSLDLKTARGTTPLQTCMDRLCQSLAAITLGEATVLDLPDGIAPRTEGEER